MYVSWDTGPQEGQNANEQVLIIIIQEESTQGNVRIQVAASFEVMLNRRMLNGIYGGVRGARNSPQFDSRACLGGRKSRVS